MREITKSTFAGNYTRIICDKCRKVIREWLDTALSLQQPCLSIDICEDCRDSERRMRLGDFNYI